MHDELKKLALQKLMEELKQRNIDQVKPLSMPKEEPMQMAENRPDVDSAIQNLLSEQSAPAPSEPQPAPALEQNPEKPSFKDLLSGKFREEQLKKQLGE